MSHGWQRDVTAAAAGSAGLRIRCSCLHNAAAAAAAALLLLLCLVHRRFLHK